MRGSVTTPGIQQADALAPGRAGLVFPSWAQAEGFRLLGGEPEMSVIPNYVISGLASVAVAIVLGVWWATRLHRRSAGPVIVLVSLVASARTWSWTLAAAVAGFLTLVPGLVVLAPMLPAADSSIVAVVTLFAFGATAAAMATARAHDRS